MARLTVDYFSDALGMATSMTVLLPEATQEQIGAGATSSGTPSSTASRS